MGIVGLYSTGYGEILEVDESLVDRYVALGWLPISGGGGGGGVTDSAVAQQVTSGAQTKGALDAAYTATVLTATTATSSAALLADRHTPVDASSGPLTMTLPTPTRVGQQVRVEKVDASANAVTVSGTLRGSAGTIAMPFQYEVLTFVAESLSSWRVASGNKTKAALDATYVRPRRPRVAAVGTSLTALYSVLTPGASIYTSGRSALAAANALLGNRFDVIGPSATVQTYGGSGLTTIQIAANGGYTGAAAADVDVVVEEGGTNDITQNMAGADIAARRVAAWDLMLAAGKVVVATTIPPRNNSGDTEAMRVEVRAANRALRAAAATRRGVVIFDCYPLLVIPATGVLDAATAVDGLHPNGVGGSRGGAALASILDRILPPTSGLDALPADDFDTKSVLTNGCMAGSGGSFVGSNSAQGSGTVPNGYQITPYTATTSIAASTIARTDAGGQWLQLATTASGASPWLDGYQVLSQDTTAGGRWNVGDTIYATCEIETDAAGWNGRGLFLDANCFGPGIYTAAGLTNSAERATATVATRRPERLVLTSPRLVVPASTTRLQARLFVYGGGTIRVSRMNIVRV